MKLLQILNEMEVLYKRFYTITVPITDEDTGKVTGSKKVLVYPEDLGKMDWDEAIAACVYTDDGEWSLPTKEELKAMYKQLHKQGKGNFKDDWYWSSTQYESDNYDQDEAFMIYFGSGGGTHRNEKGNTYQVRPVRDI